MPKFLVPSSEPRENPFESFMRAFQAGLAMRQQREQMDMEREDRDTRRAMLKLEMDRLKLQDRLSRMQTAFGLMEGRPGPQVQQQVGVSREIGSPEGQPVMGTTEGPHPEFDFTELLGDALPPNQRFMVRPRTAGELLEQQGAQREAELAAEVQKAAALEGVKRQPVAIRLPNGQTFEVPGVIADQFATGLMTGQNQAADRTFQAEQKALDRAAEDARSRRSTATTLRAAEIQAGATRENQRGTREDKMLDDFARDTKDFAAMDDAYHKMVSARGAKTPQSDMALMYSYVRMLDPGSVVREGEYATAANAASVPERVRSAYNKVVGGGLLSDSQRDGFIQAATRVRSSVEPRRQELIGRYRTRAARRGIDPELFSMGAAPRGGAPNGADPLGILSR